MSGWSVALVVLALALLAFAGVSFLAHQRILVAHSLAAADQMGELALDLGPGRAVVGGQVGVGLAGAGSGQLVLVGGDGDGAASRCAGAPGRRLWKTELARFAAETGLAVTVCHFPPGTSKWNKIEHRLFSHISTSWRGRPLVSHGVVVELIAATRTRSDLRVHAGLDRGSYPLGVKISDRELAAVPLRRHGWHGSGTTRSSRPPHSQHARAYRA